MEFVKIGTNLNTLIKLAGLLSRTVVFILKVVVLKVNLEGYAHAPKVTFVRQTFTFGDPKIKSVLMNIQFPKRDQSKHGIFYFRSLYFSEMTFKKQSERKSKLTKQAP